jgi:hypothetical protein
MIGRSLSVPARELGRGTNRVIRVETFRSLLPVGYALTLPQLRTLLPRPLRHLVTELWSSANSPSARVNTIVGLPQAIGRTSCS